MEGRALSADEALAWLLAFADREHGVGWNPRASTDERWKTGRTRALLDLAGAPDRALARRVAIAGTNGKGSTGAILESILRAAGWRVGVYSQPHLHSFRERIRLDGDALAPPHFAAGVARLRPLVDALRREHPAAGDPTAFELTTLLATLVFADERVDAGLLEVGLGGRLDPVNAIDVPLALISSIGYDHVQILGGTLGAIAREKAGLLRPGALALSAWQRPAAARALSAVARRVGARLRSVPPLASAGPVDPAHGQLVALPDGGTAWLSLLGQHQRQNAALAVAAAQTLLGELPRSAAADGLSAARWPGRLEWVAGAPPIVLDGAHNPPGAAALAAALDEIAPHRSIGLVFGCARDKSAPGLLRPLLRRAIGVWTAAADDPRSADPDSLARVVGQLGGRGTRVGSVAEALDAARGAGCGLVVAAGSLRIVAEARQALGLAPASLE